MMHLEPSERPILALTYTDGDVAASVLGRLQARLSSAGASCAGVLQSDVPAADASCRCDMVLECLSTGHRIKISEDRGAHARGCRLSVGDLMAALEAERRMLAARPDVLIVNKFGKTESEGGGFRPLVAAAVELGVPVILTVPWRNIESWRLFAGEFAIEWSAETLAADDDWQVLARIGLIRGEQDAGSHLHANSAARWPAAER